MEQQIKDLLATAKKPENGNIVFEIDDNEYEVAIRASQTALQLLGLELLQASTLSNESEYIINLKENESAFQPKIVVRIANTPSPIPESKDSWLAATGCCVTLICIVLVFLAGIYQVLNWLN